MTLIVQKFGGTSMATPEVIKKTATLIEKEHALGHQVVVVVSAMAGVTDQLASYVQEISVAPDAREYDAVVSTGEQITAGLMALALKGRGIVSKSWLGWQLPLQTTADYTRGRITTLNIERLRMSLARREIPVIAGFQGVSEDDSVVTLGRGGSDLSAVALAAALKADSCHLYKDVPGIMTADPKIVTKARLINRISYEEMLELSSLGSKILQTRSIALAASYKVPLWVRPTFSKGKGTTILAYEETMEAQAIRGITCNCSQAFISLTGIKHIPDLFSAFARAHILVDMVAWVSSSSLTFTTSCQEAQRAISIAKSIQSHPMETNLETSFATLSLVGLGLRGQPDIIAKALKTLGDRNIEVHSFCTSEMKISLLIEATYAELALRLLHTSFGLDRDYEHELRTEIPEKALAARM